MSGYDSRVKDQELYAAWLNLARVFATIRTELDRTLERETGIGLSEGEVLCRLVCASPQCLRMSDLADRLCMAQSGMTRVVDRLVDRGLVVREVRPGNRRTIDAHPTAAGRAAFERISPIYRRIIHDRFGQRLRSEDAAVLRVLLRTVLEGLGTTEDIPWTNELRTTG